MSTNHCPEVTDLTVSSSGATEDVRGATPQTAVSKPVDSHSCEINIPAVAVCMCSPKYISNTPNGWVNAQLK